MPARKPTAAKLDLVKDRPEYFKATKNPKIVTLRPVNYLSIEGKGAPESPAFQAAVAGLYGMAWTLKMTRKLAGTDYKVCPLEGLWWSEYDTSKLGDPEALWSVPRDTWCWKLLIMTPDFIGEQDMADARKKLAEKKNESHWPQVKLETIDEGRCVQILHLGLYKTEPDSILKMRQVARAQRLVDHGLHHEIYLSDPRRTAPERLRTILRHPVIDLIPML